MGQITITVETTSLLIVRARNSRRLWCATCGTEVETLELPTRDISALRQLPQDVHRTDAPDGVTLICLQSLLAGLHTKPMGN
jgi:hypothetical protein